MPSIRDAVLTTPAPAQHRMQPGAGRSPLANGAMIDARTQEALGHVLINALAWKRVEEEVAQRPELRAPAGELPPKDAMARKLDQIALRPEQEDDLQALLTHSAGRHLNPTELAARSGQPQENRTPAGSSEIMKSDQMFVVMVALMQLLMQLGRVSRDASSAATNMQVDATRSAGKKGVAAAETRLGGSIAAVATGAAVGAAGLRQSAKGNMTTAKSGQNNTVTANANREAAAGGRTAAAANNKLAGAPRPQKELQLRSDPDKSVTVPAANSSVPKDHQAIQDKDGRDEIVRTHEAAATQAGTHANNQFARSSMISTLNQGVQGMVTSTAELPASAQEAEKLLLQTSADIAAKIAASEKEQVGKQGQQSDGAMQALETYFSQRDTTTQTIIGNC